MSRMNADQEAEYQKHLVAKGQLTRRPVVPALEELMFAAMPALDHGFVRVIDYMGNDAALVQAARVSYGRGTKSVSDDRALIRYLIRARHNTPVEMAEIKLHVKLPIFVARQWIRHRTGAFNEMSARYSILDNEFYLPEPEVLGQQSKNNKQGRAGELEPDQSELILRIIKEEALHAYSSYEDLLNDRGDGQPVHPENPQLARELARMNLTLGFYTQWYWKVNLHNLLHFLSLRMDSHAQYEIRVYADIIGQIVAAWVPNAWEAFVDYRYEAATFSRQEVAVLRELAGLGASALNLPGPTSLRNHIKGMFERNGVETVRERAEFLAKLNIKIPPEEGG